MTTQTRTRAVNEVVEATGGHGRSLLSVDELRDVTDKPQQQTPTATLL